MSVSRISVVAHSTDHDAAVQRYQLLLGMPPAHEFSIPERDLTVTVFPGLSVISGTADALASVRDLRATAFHPLRIPLVNNADAEITTSGDEARESLVRQVTLPVRWEESVRELIEQGVNTFVEVGPGRVLTGLLRQIDRSIHVFNVEDEKSLRSTLERLAQAQTESAEV